MKKLLTTFILSCSLLQMSNGQVIPIRPPLNALTTSISRLPGNPSFSRTVVTPDSSLAQGRINATGRENENKRQAGNYFLSASLTSHSKPMTEPLNLPLAVKHMESKPLSLLPVGNASQAKREVAAKPLIEPTQTNIANGTTGSVSLEAGYGARQKAAASLQLTHRTKKLTLYAEYAFLHNHFRQAFTNYRRVDYNQSSTNTWDTITRTPSSLNHSAHVAIEYALTAKTTLRGMCSGFRNMVTVGDEAIRTTILQAGQVGSPIHLSHQESNQWQHLMGNLSLRHQLSSKQELTFELDYLRYHDYNSHLFTQINQAADEASTRQDLFTINRTIPIGIGVGKGEYIHSISKRTKLEAGVKATLTQFTSNLLLKRLNQEEWHTDSTASYQVNRREANGASYLTLHHHLNAKSNLQMGVRWEYSFTQVRTAQLGAVLQSRTGNVLPSLSFSRELSKGRDLLLSYRRSLNRPTYNNLGAYLFPTDPFSGNIALQPALADALIASYRFKETYLATLSFRSDKNFIIPLQIHVNPQTNQQYAQAENFKNAQTYSLAFSFPLNLTPWWQIQGNVTGGWQQHRTTYEGFNIQVQTLYSKLNLVQTFRLPQDITAQLSGVCQTRSLFGIGYLKAFGTLNLAVEKRFPNDKGTVKLSAEDLLGTMRLTLINHQPSVNLNQALQARFTEPRIIRIAYSRTFGNKHVQRMSQRTNGFEEERQRATN